MSEHEFWKDLGGIFDAVLNYQKKNVEFNKQFINPWLRLGNIFDREDQHKEAVEVYSHATEIDPESAQNWISLGDAQFKNGEFDHAATSYAKAIELNPGFGWPKSNLALTYVMQTKYEEAIPLYLESIELFSDDQDKAICWNRLGNVYRKINDYQNAFSAFQNADKLDSNNTGFTDVLDDLSTEDSSSSATTSLEDMIIDKPAETAVELSAEILVELNPDMSEGDVSESETSVQIQLTSEEIESQTATGYGPNVAIDIEEDIETDHHMNLPEPEIASIENEPNKTINEEEASPEDDQELRSITDEEVTISQLPDSLELDESESTPEIDGNNISESADEELEEKLHDEVNELLPTLTTYEEETVNISSESPIDDTRSLAEYEESTYDSQIPEDFQNEFQQDLASRKTTDAFYQNDDEDQYLEKEADAAEQLAPNSPESTAAEVDFQTNEVEIENASNEAAYEEYLMDVSGSVEYIEQDETSGEQPLTEVTPDGEVRIAMDTKNAHVWNELGNVYFNSGNFDDAIASYGKAIELDQSFAWPYSNLALAYVQKGSFAEAILLYQRGLELFGTEKDKAITWNRLGNVYRRLGDYPNAIAAYQTADELDTENATLSLRSNFGLLGNMFAEQKQA